MNLQRFLTVIIMIMLIDGSRAGPHQIRLLRHLFGENYSVLERPVANDTQPLVVSLTLTLQQIVDVDEKNQFVKSTGWISMSWTAYHLKWDPDDFGGISVLRVPPTQVWKPDILLYNSADDSFDSSLPTNVVIYNDGTCLWVPPGMFRSTCQIDITWFPFDEQRCKMKFGAWSHDGFQIELVTSGDHGDQSSFIPNGEWLLLGIPAQRNNFTYDCCPEPYYDIVFTIYIRRKVLFYLYNIILPGMIMSSLTMLSFTIPAEAGEKISFGVTILLSLTVFSLLVAESMPPTSDAIPLAGMYFAFIMTLCAMSVGFTVMVLNIHHRNVETHVLSKFIKVGINVWLAWILRMQKPGQPLKRENLLERARRRTRDVERTAKLYKPTEKNSSRSLLANVLDIDDDLLASAQTGGGGTENGYFNLLPSNKGSPLKPKHSGQNASSAVAPLYDEAGAFHDTTTIQNGNVVWQRSNALSGACNATSAFYSIPGEPRTFCNLTDSQCDECPDIGNNPTFQRCNNAQCNYNAVPYAQLARRASQTNSTTGSEDMAAGGVNAPKCTCSPIYKPVVGTSAPPPPPPYDSRLYNELRFITERMRNDDKTAEVNNEWRFAAAVLDRFCILCFITFNVVATCGILLSAPNLHIFKHNDDDA